MSLTPTSLQPRNKPVFALHKPPAQPTASCGTESTPQNTPDKPETALDNPTSPPLPAPTQAQPQPSSESQMAPTPAIGIDEKPTSTPDATTESTKPTLTKSKSKEVQSNAPGLKHTQSVVMTEPKRSDIAQRASPAADASLQPAGFQLVAQAKFAESITALHLESSLSKSVYLPTDWLLTYCLRVEFLLLCQGESSSF